MAYMQTGKHLYKLNKVRFKLWKKILIRAHEFFKRRIGDGFSSKLHHHARKKRKISTYKILRTADDSCDPIKQMVAYTGDRILIGFFCAFAYRSPARLMSVKITRCKGPPTDTISLILGYVKKAPGKEKSRSPFLFE